MTPASAAKRRGLLPAPQRSQVHMRVSLFESLPLGYSWSSLKPTIHRRTGSSSCCICLWLGPLLTNCRKTARQHTELFSTQVDCSPSCLYKSVTDNRGAVHFSIGRYEILVIAYAAITFVPGLICAQSFLVCFECLSHN